MVDCYLRRLREVIKLLEYLLKTDFIKNFTVEIPSEYNGKPVVAISDNAFLGYSSLVKVTIPDTVTRIGNNAFGLCLVLSDINIPDSVTSIGDHAFTGCVLLTSIMMPDSVITIVYGAFSGCSNLSSIEIPDSVTSIGDAMFSDCTSLVSIEVDENNEYYKSIDGNLYSKDESTLVHYAIGKKETSFTIPNSVTNIGVGAFLGCTCLQV